LKGILTLSILLVSIHPYPSAQSIPLATAFLQSYLSAKMPPDAETDVRMVEFFPGQPLQEYVDVLTTFSPVAIGFSMYVWNRSLCCEIADSIRRKYPNIRLFAGGPEATADPSGVLQQSGCFDFLVIGEGEETFAAAYQAILKGQPLTGLSGIATLKDKTLHLLPPQPVTDLDQIPSPWLSGTLDACRCSGILWQLSRGCGFSCDFCFDARGSAGVRRFSLQRIEEELKHFAKSRVSQIFVLDSTFNQDAQRAKTILRMIKKRAPLIHFHFEARSEFIDKEMAQLFAQIICSLQIGLQSSDPSVLKGIGRNFNRKDFEKRINMLNETGAVFGFDLMFGLPGDTLEGFGNSLDFALGLYPNHLDIFPLAILPGTALADRAEMLGLQYLSSPPYTLVSAPGFSPADMSSASRLANACDIFYTRGKAVAWFNSVVSATGTTPSLFLTQFGQWLEKSYGSDVRESDLDDSQIWQLQRSFVTQIFDSKQLKRLLNLALDLVDYHYHYAAALLAAVPEPLDETCLLQVLEHPGRLADSTRLVTFKNEILDILEACEPDLRKLNNLVAKTGSWAVIYPSPDGIRTESLIEPYFRLLENLNGKTNCGKIAERLDIPEDEAIDFLEFAILEGIIV
jgi:radical SAM superfamily enzyme YgiQ (UPF0313 family)